MLLKDTSVFTLVRDHTHVTHATKDLLNSVALTHTSVLTRVRDHTHVTCATRNLLQSVTLTHTSVFTQVRNHTSVTRATRDIVISVTYTHKHTHTGGKPYKCNRCHETFRCLGHLNTPSTLTRVRHGHRTHVTHATLDLPNSVALTHTSSLFAQLTDYTSVTCATCHLVISIILTDPRVFTLVGDRTSVTHATVDLPNSVFLIHTSVLTCARNCMFLMLMLRHLLHSAITDTQTNTLRLLGALVKLYKCTYREISE